MILRTSIFVAFCSVLCGEVISTEEDFAKAINSFFAIHDAKGALDTASVAKSIFPESKAVHHLYVKALADGGLIDEAILALGEITSDEILVEKFSLIEEIAWNQLLQYQEGREMGAFLTMYGAAITGDAKAVTLIQQNLQSSNAYLRYLAVRLTGYYPDQILQKEILRLLEEEKNWFVQNALVEVVGTLKIKEGASHLKKVISSHQTSGEEKAIAIRSLVSLYERVEKSEIEVLLKSPRAGLRELGLALILSMEGDVYHHYIYEMLSDTSPDVKAKALFALGALSIDRGKLWEKRSKLFELVEDKHPRVSAVASWVLLKVHEEKARAGLSAIVKGDSADAARFAAALMGLGGRATAITVQELFSEVTDPYVKANLALSMLRQRTDFKRATQYLRTFMEEKRDLVMWEDSALMEMRVLGPSRVRHVPYVAGYPSIVDQTTRLDLINQICLVGEDNIKELLRDYLKVKAWGVAAGAAVLLLEEGDLEAIDIVRELLNDKEEKVVLQAALALAFYAKDSDVRQVLESQFVKVDWDTKIHILEALGSIGSRKSIPFLLERLRDSSPMIKKIAAAGVIQCLYH